MTLGWRIAFCFVLSVAIVAVAALYMIGQRDAARDVSSGAKSSDPPIVFRRNVPVYTNLLNPGEITVPQARMWYLSFTVPSDAIGASTVTGKFTASGGTGNDIVVVLMDQDNLTNWMNGHAAQSYYFSGQETTGTLNVNLRPGNYVLALDNRFSLLTAKYVNIWAVLKYNHLE